MGNNSYCLPCRRNKKKAPYNSTLYAFPKCPVRRKKWSEKLSLGDMKIPLKARVCEHHFTPDQKVTVLLKKDAVPKLRELPTAIYEKFAPPARCQSGGQAKILPKMGTSVNINLEMGFLNNLSLIQPQPTSSPSGGNMTYFVPALIRIDVGEAGHQGSLVIPPPVPVSSSPSPNVESDPLDPGGMEEDDAEVKLEIENDDGYDYDRRVHAESVLGL